MTESFTYQILSVDAAARCMLVEYAATGKTSVVVSTRVPFAGESLDSVVASYSPLPFWQQQEMDIDLPLPGVVGAWSAPVDPPVTVASYTNAVQGVLDAKARERNYDGILSACTYSTSSVPKFQAEGQACVAWRDAVWASCYSTLAQVEAQQIPQPTVAELVASLPTMTWPA